ncbi:MAG TPA: hypothetical protein VI643_04750, partial [Planctomycetota bacterium]|nr:hypothetical protein [Planctomycetota bacterium]
MDSRKAILGFVRSARRRLSTIRGLYWAQRALFAAICVAVVAIAFERATGLWNPPVWTLGAAAGLVALAGIVAYFVPRRSMLAAAAEVDARAGWKEALSSAIAVGEPKESMEMALLEDAR